MAACSRGIYPPAVVADVKKQVKAAVVGDEIPESLALKESMINAKLDDAVMVEIEIDGSNVREVDVLLGSEMIKKHSGTAGSICFVALTLSVLAALYKQLFEGFEIFGIVKETGVDDKGLADFHNKYFDYGLYCDKAYTFYHALGDRKIGLGGLFNPLTIFSVLCEAFQRIRRKQITGNVSGEAFVQGGIIFFGPDGRPVCAYEEETGKDVPLAAILTAMKAIRQPHKKRR